MTAPELPRRWTPDEVAQLRGVCTETVRLRCRLDEEGRATWPHHRDGRRVYFTEADLAAIEELQAVPARPARTRGRTPGSATYHQKPATSPGRRSRIR